jgi:hypothetical protein
MATKTKQFSPNSRRCKDMAGDFPRYMTDGNNVTQLSHLERAVLRFCRALPNDLRGDFDACLRLKGEAFNAGLEAFKAKMEPRRSELIGW